MVRFLLDRSFGQRALVATLRDAGWDAVTLAEQFGDARAQRMGDEEWIGEGARAGYFLLAKDHRIASRPLEAYAIYVHDAKVVTLSRGDLTSAQMGRIFLSHTAQIAELAAARGPFVFSLSDNGLKRRRLNAP